MTALVIVAVFGLVALTAQHHTARTMARLFGEIEERAAAERHVLAGRIQNPALFPTRPLAAVPDLPGEKPEPIEPTMSGFDAAGQDVSHLPLQSLEELFEPGFMKNEASRVE